MSVSDQNQSSRTWVALAILAFALLICTVGGCMFGWFAMGGMDTIMSA